MTPAHLHALVYTAAALATLGAVPGIWRRRAARGARPLLGMLVAAGWWSAWLAVEVVAQHPTLLRMALKLHLLGAAAAAPLYLETVVALVRRPGILRLGSRLLLWGVPAVAVSFAHADAQRHLAVPPIERALADLLGGDGRGPAYLLVGFEALVITVLATALLLRTAAALVPPFGRRFRLTAVAGLLPWLGLALSSLGALPLPGLDWTPVGVSAMAALIAWSVLRQGLLDLAPLAYEVALEQLGEGVMVLDARGRIRYANQTARRLLGPSVTGALELAAAWAGAGEHGTERRTVSLGSGAGLRLVEARTDLLRGWWGEVAGRLVRLADVTEQRRRAEERERVLSELTAALVDVQQLRGLLPVCPDCKKVRDDQGYWRQVEAWVEKRSKLAFSHGICPECVEKLYPEVAKAIAARKAGGGAP